MTARTSSTDQHYVPQFLLRGFSSGKRKQLYVFDKALGRVFRSSVRNLACERNFYEFENDSASDASRVDRWLGQLEHAAAPIIESVRTRCALQKLGAAERQWVAAFVAVQIVRTRQHREQWAHLVREVTQTLVEMGADLKNVEGFQPMTDEQIRHESIAGIPSSAFKLLPHILDKAWLLFSAPRAHPFWIGDHPVTLANNLNPGDGIRGTLGVAVRGIEIYIPFSSEIMLGCLCPTVLSMFLAAKNRLINPEHLSRGRVDEFLAAFEGSTTVLLEPENVMYHNSLQVLHAERFLYSAHNDFEVARDMIKTNPHARVGPRAEMVGGRRQVKKNMG